MRGRAWCESTLVSPWPGKCLVHAATAGGLEALDVGGGVPGGELGVGAEGPYADDGVVRVGVDVRGRGPVEVDPALGEAAAQLAGDVPGEAGVVDGAEGQVAGEGRAAADLEAGDVAALLVDGDQDVVPLGAQLRGQRGELFGRGDVAAEQADRGEAFADPAEQPGRGRGALEAGLEDREGVPRDRVGAVRKDSHGGRYPFTA